MATLLLKTEGEEQILGPLSKKTIAFSGEGPLVQ